MSSATEPGLRVWIWFLHRRQGHTGVLIRIHSLAVRTVKPGQVVEPEIDGHIPAWFRINIVKPSKDSEKKIAAFSIAAIHLALHHNFFFQSTVCNYYTIEQKKLSIDCKPGFPFREKVGTLYAMFCQKITKFNR